MSDEKVEQIRKAHESARPDPSLNTAWANAHHDIGIVLAAYDALVLRLNERSSQLEVALREVDRLGREVDHQGSRLDTFEKAYRGSEKINEQMRGEIDAAKVRVDEWATMWMAVAEWLNRARMNAEMIATARDPGSSERIERGTMMRLAQDIVKALDEAESAAGCDHEPGVDCPLHPMTEENQIPVEGDDFILGENANPDDELQEAASAVERRAPFVSRGQEPNGTDGK